MNDIAERLRKHIDVLAPPVSTREITDRVDVHPLSTRVGLPRVDRRWPVVSIAASVVVLAGVGSVALYVREQSEEIDRIEVAGLAPATASSSAVPASGNSDDVPPLANPVNILVVGVDGIGSDGLSYGTPGKRADTIIIVRIDPIDGQIRLLSIPRDLWVTTDDGTSRRINSYDDPGDLVQVVSSTLGLDINHYVEVDFDGFRSLIDLAVGVTVPFDTPVRDRQTGFKTGAGCRVLSGDEALAYVRARHLEIFDPSSGDWVLDPRSDIGRTERQRDLIRRVLASVLTQDYSAADKVRLATSVLDDLTVDRGLDVRGLQAIFNAAAIIGPYSVFDFDLWSLMTPQVIDGNTVLVADGFALKAEAEKLQVPSDTAPPTAGADSTDEC